MKHSTALFLSAVLAVLIVALVTAPLWIGAILQASE